MALNRRGALLAALALPAGCAIRPLAPLATTAIPAPSQSGFLRPPRAGQKWTYRRLNSFNGSLLDVVQESVASSRPTVDVARRGQSGTALADEKHATWGQLLRDPAWDYPMTFETPMPLWPASFTVGAKELVNGRYRMDGGSFSFWIQVYCIARGWERVTVNAGTFDTLRVERLIRLQHHDFTRASTVRWDTMWLSLDIGRWVARDTFGEYRQRGGSGPLFATEQEDQVRWELTGWQ